MKHRIIIFISIFSFFAEDHGAFAAHNELTSANAAYEAEDYDLALEEYKKLISEGYLSADLFYNAGNAYYRNGEYGEAIWAFEKALRLNPSDEQARQNLTFVNDQTRDKIDNSRPGIGSWFQSVLFVPQVNLWAWTSILSSALFALSLIIYFTANTSRRRMAGLFFGGLTGSLLLFTTITAHQHKMFITEQTEGIIVAETSEVMVTPQNKSRISFSLSEGAKVQLISTSTGWVQVEINGNSGWVKEEEVWKI